MSTKEQLVEGALQAAIDACTATCGNWHSIKQRDGTKLLVCPCAEAIKKIYVPILVARIESKP